MTRCRFLGIIGSGRACSARSPGAAARSRPASRLLTRTRLRHRSKPGPNQPGPGAAPAQATVAELARTRSRQARRSRQPRRAASWTGKAFAPDRVELEGNRLILRQGKEFFADLSVEIILDGKTKPAEGTEARRQTELRSGPTAFRRCTFPSTSGKGLPDTKFVNEGYALTLELGKADKGKSPGKIYLCLPDAEKSYLAGTFTAAAQAVALGAAGTRTRFRSSRDRSRRRSRRGSRCRSGTSVCRPAAGTRSPTGPAVRCSATRAAVAESGRRRSLRAPQPSVREVHAGVRLHQPPARPLPRLCPREGRPGRLGLGRCGRRRESHRRHQARRREDSARWR